MVDGVAEELGGVKAGLVVKRRAWFYFVIAIDEGGMEDYFFFLIFLSFLMNNSKSALKIHGKILKIFFSNIQLTRNDKFFKFL